MSKFLTRLFAQILAIALLAQPVLAAEREPLIVFAAASLTDVLQKAGPLHTQQSNVPVKFSFAASSALAKQIESGARMDAFFSADQDWMNYLQERKLIKVETRSDLLGNRLALIAPKDSKVTLKLQRGAPLPATLGADGRLATARCGSNRGPPSGVAHERLGLFLCSPFGCESADRHGRERLNRSAAPRIVINTSRN
jgi:molybdate transport system substrate-binding protein